MSNLEYESRMLDLKKQHEQESKIKYDEHNRKPVKHTTADLAKQARRREVRSFLERIKRSWNQRLAITHIDDIEPISKYW